MAMHELQSSRGASRIWRLFHAIDDDGDGWIEAVTLVEVLARAGFETDDRRLAGLFGRLAERQGARLDFTAFLAVLGADSLIFERVVRGDLAVPDFASFAEEMARIFAEAAAARGGRQARYVAPLAEVNPERFGLAAVTVDGQILRLGDAGVDFSIQSICKPFNYCFALEEQAHAGLQRDAVHRWVGMEPSGRRYDAAALMEDGTDRPYNPMVNAGAIVTAALIRPGETVDERLDRVRRLWALLTGGDAPRLDTRMREAEGRAGHRNRLLARALAEAGAMPGGPSATPESVEDALGLYFGTCALTLTVTEVATAAATLANGGICPLTRSRALRRRTVRDCLSMMQMSGMYDGSGEFCLRIGLPAKSGVGGGIFLVVPGLMGVCVWSPRLNAHGNSVRGVRVAELLAARYRLHAFDPPAVSADRPDPRLSLSAWRAAQTARALWAAGCGDVQTLDGLLNQQVDLGRGDYDRRTPLHLAAATGHMPVIRLLLDAGVDADPIDRWGRGPLDEAESGGHAAVVALLKAHAVRRDPRVGPAERELQPQQALDFGDDLAVAELLWAAAADDLDGLRRLVARGVPLHAADYDGRTALHLAACEGAERALDYLLAHGHPIDVRDVWGATPLDDARREHHDGTMARLIAVTRSPTDPD